MNDLETVKLLAQLATGGLAMVVVSWLLERVDAFQQLASASKAWIVLGLTLAVALAAQGVLQFATPALLAAIEPYVKVTLGVITAWLTSQTYHAVQKRVKASASDGAQDGAQG